LSDEAKNHEKNQSDDNQIEQACTKRGPKPKKNPPKSSNKPKRKKNRSAQKATNTSEQANDTIQTQNDSSSSIEHTTSIQPNKTIEKTITNTPNQSQSENASCPKANRNNKSIPNQNEDNNSRPKRNRRPPDRYQA
jgi:hypothetical protein